MPYYVLISSIIAVFLSLSVEASRLVVAIGTTPNNLDPYYATDANSQDLNRLIHLSLVDANSKMETTCVACERFTEKRLTDGRQIITFWLKKGLTFANGTALTSKHVVTSVQKLLAKEGAPIPNLFKELIGAKRLGDFEVELEFSQFRPENLTNLALLKIELFTDEKRIAAGDFELIHNDELNYLLRHRDGRELEFKVVADETTMALKLLNGEIDLIATGMSPRKTQWLSEQKKIVRYETEGTNYVYIAPQHQHEDLSDFRVRRALSHLIPRQELARYKMKDTVALAEGMFSSAFKDLFLDVGAIKYDPMKAQTLLESAGYQKKENQWWKNERQLSFTIKISNKKHIIELARAIVPYWEKFGIDLKVQAAEWGTFYRDLKSGNFDLAMGQWVGFVGPDQMGFTFLEASIPPNGANRGNYKDKSFEELYSKALASNDENEQKTFYRLANKRLIDDEAYISLWHPKIIWLGRECVKKLKPYPTGNFLAFKSLEHTCQH